MNIIKSKKQMFIVIGAFALVLLLGTASYAFFNYTRTGAANNIQTGKINFQSTQTTNPVTVSNLFPIEAADIPTAATTFNASTSKFARVIVHIEGETTWEEGIDYVVSAVNTNLQVGTSLNKLPLKIHVYESTDQLTHTGDLTGDLLTLPYETAGTLTEGKVTLASGHIAGNSTYGNGTRYKRDIIIDAYILASDIAITDTPEESSEWVNGRTRYSTTEWNALATSGASFKILVESNEKQPSTPVVPTIASCQNCKFVYTTSNINYGGASNEDATDVSTLSGVTTNYTTLNRNNFLGFTEVDDGNGNMVVDKVYACGIKQEAPHAGTAFCIEGSTDGSTFTSNSTLIAGETLWDDADGSNGRCIFDTDYGSEFVTCSDTSFGATSDDSGYVSVGSDGASCNVNNYGSASCM